MIQTKLPLENPGRFTGLIFDGGINQFVIIEVQIGKFLILYMIFSSDKINNILIMD
jgi:hypothetical protein